MQMINIQVTKDEMLQFYANKIVEQAIQNCKDNNCTISLKNYSSDVDILNYKMQMLQELYKDERILDVFWNSEDNIEVILFKEYCPFYCQYGEQMPKSEQARILLEFYKYSKKTEVFKPPYVSVRKLLNKYMMRYANKRKEIRSTTSDVIKRNIVDTGFINKYLDKNGEAYITIKNYQEFLNLIADKIAELNMQSQEGKEEVEED